MALRVEAAATSAIVAAAPVAAGAPSSAAVEVAEAPAVAEAEARASAGASRVAGAPAAVEAAAPALKAAAPAAVEAAAPAAKAAASAVTSAEAAVSAAKAVEAAAPAAKAAEAAPAAKASEAVEAAAPALKAAAPAAVEATVPAARAVEAAPAVTSAEAAAPAAKAAEAAVPAAKAAEASVGASVPAPAESRDDALELRLSELEILGPSAPRVAAAAMPRPPAARGRPSAPPGGDLRIAGRFARRRTIAQGGMGQVLECVDERLQRRVAVKALRPEYLGNPTATGLLEREAQITASLSHPGIVPVHDLGVDPAVGPFYVMPLLEGVTLREVLTQLRSEPAALAFYRLDRLVRAFIRVCHAVEHAHGRGVVHCDLKPANVVLGDFSEVVIIDWALAYRRGEGLPFRGGTVGYLALEQLDPHTNHFTARTDVFALGSLLYELLTLQPAFASSTVSAAFAARSKGRPVYEMPEPPDRRAPERKIPEEVAEVCMRALALEPEGRYATVAEFVRELQEAADGSWVRLRRVADEAQQLALKAARSFIQSVTPRRRPGR
ncbi:MAG TPA: serine/threonine-protein kinase [Polyangiaceae bacterium]|nr:serine/threonine-protein kinase [Polyangiaceae bacterium]